jgi:hypothetical protein
MDHAHVSYKSHTMALLLAMGLAPLFPSNAQRLDIHSYDFLISCITYTKQLLSSLSPYFGSIEISNSSNPLSAPLLLDLSVDIGFLLTAGLLPVPLLEFETFVVLKDTPSVVVVSTQITFYVACQ